MSDPLASLHLKLPYLAAAQGQKHVTHNEALRRLDSLVQLAVIDSSLTDPPEEPDEGDRYIVASGGTGAWQGRDGDLASHVDGAWDFDTPEDGWLAFDIAAGVLLAHQAPGWAAVSGVPSTVDHLGINATPDDTNRLAVKSEAVLFSGIAAADGGSGDIRFVVNKEADGDTASLLFQSGWSGRAEVGLCGDADFVFKVSPDGATWIEAIRIDKDTGLPALIYDNSASGLAATTVQDAIDDLAGGAPTAGFRNKLINGGFAIFQRGASIVVAAAGSAYVADRWLVANTTDQAVTVSQQAVAVGSLFDARYKLRLAFAAAPTTGTVRIEQRIDGVATLQGETASARAYFTGPAGAETLACEVVQTFGTGGSAAVTTAAASLDIATIYDAASERRRAQFAVPSITGKTIGTSDYLALAWTLTPRQAGNYEMKRASLVDGDASAETDPFAPRHIQQELALCHRYFRLLGGAAPAAAEVLGLGQGYGATGCAITITHDPPMRATPARSVSAVGDFRVWNATTVPLVVTSFSWQTGSARASTALVGVASGLVAGNNTSLIPYNWATLSLDAEL